MPSSLPSNARHHDGSTLPSGGPRQQGSGSAPTGQGEPARQLGPYVLQRELGRGSYGAVFLARHRSGGQEVALKVLLGAQDAETVTRFRREAAITSKLQTPAIVRTLDVGFDGQHHYYAMDYCPGPTLKERLRQGPMNPVEAARLVAQLANAAAEAHQWAVIHRDLKPANVILTGPEGAPRITDFGLARDYAQERLTHTGDVLGTPAYMAPEQFRGDRSVDHRVDIYALGVTLYQLLTGQVPYMAQNLPELGRLVEAGQATPPRALDPEIPAQLETSCLRAMACDPAQRYPTASAFATDLLEFAKQPRGPAKPRQVSRRTTRPGGTRDAKVLARTLSGWVVAAVLLGGLIYRSSVDSAPAPAEPANAEAAANPMALAEALDEIELQRSDRAPPSTIARQIRRALSLTTDPVARERLEGELTDELDAQAAIDEVQRLLEELTQKNTELRDPASMTATARALASALEQDLPPYLQRQARDQLIRFEDRGLMHDHLQQLSDMLADNFRANFLAFEGCQQWAAAGSTVEEEGLQLLLPLLTADTHPSRALLRGIVLHRLGRGEEARQAWQVIPRNHPKLGRSIHHFEERGLLESEAQAIVQAVTAQ